MSYSKFSTSLASYISSETQLGEDEKEVIAYSIENLILGIAGFVLILIIGFVFNAVIPAAIAAITGGLLRRVSGGAHSSTPLRCLIIGSFAYGTIGVLSYYASSLFLNKYFFLFGLGVALTLAIIYAPVDCAAKPIHSLILRKRLKMASIFFLISIMVLVIYVDSVRVNTAITFGALYQSITLIPILNKGGEQNA